MSENINRFNARKKIKIVRKMPKKMPKRDVIYKFEKGYFWNPITFDFGELGS